jgi:hypothetical protein
MAVYNKCPFCNSCTKQILFNDGLYFFCDFCLRTYKKNSDGSFVDVSDQLYGGMTYTEALMEIFGLNRKGKHGNLENIGSRGLRN